MHHLAHMPHNTLDAVLIGVGLFVMLLLWPIIGKDLT